VCLRFAYLLAVRIVTALRLCRRGEDHKTAEILLLRHQLAVLQRQLAATGKRPRPDWADRAIIALLLGLITKARRAGLRLFITPDTILHWHRDLLRRRWTDKSRPKNGRPATQRNIKTLGSAHCTPESGLGLPADPRRVGRTRHPRRRLHRVGDPQERRRRPRPRRGTVTWADFLRSQAEGILAADFFTADLLDGTKIYVLAVIEHATRRIRILGSTLDKSGEWTTQMARNMLMDLEDHAAKVKFLIRDRGSKLHCRLRRRPGRRWHPHRPVQHTDPSHERDHGTLDRIGPPRTPEPHPDLEPRTSPPDPARLRTHHNTHRPHMSLSAAAPLKPLPPNVTST
jgi:hypothetical protein